MPSNVPYSGGTIVNTTFTTTVGTRLEIVAGIEAALTSAGWSTISGGGTGDVLMKSAVTANGNSIRIRLYDPGSGNCAQLMLKNNAGTLTSQTHWLLPAAGKVFKVIACKFNAFVFTPLPTAARGHVSFGTLHIDINASPLNSDLGWIESSAFSDSDATYRYSWRTGVAHVDAAGNYSRWASWIIGSNLTNCSNASGKGGLRIIMRSGDTTNTQLYDYAYQFHDDSYLTYEAAIVAGLTSVTTDSGKIMGYIHNAMIVSKEYPGDELGVTSYDGHAWYGLTNNFNGCGNPACQRGTMFLAIT